MRIDNKTSQVIVLVLVDSVLDNRKDVKSTQDGVSQVHIVIQAQLGVIPALDGVGCCNHTASCLQGSHYACL